VTWKERGLTLRQETSFPKEEGTTLKLKLAKPTRFTLKVRKPAWSDAKAEGELKDGYFEITRDWKDGDEVKVSLPMKIQAEKLPDGSDWVAFRYGPLVLAGVTGTEDMVGLFGGEGRGDHIAKGRMLPMDGAPTLLVEDANKAADVVKRTADGFSLGDVVEPAGDRGMKLVPFYQIHGARYAVYFRAMTPAKYAAERERLVVAEREKLALEKRTVDLVRPGEQQSEVDHKYKGENTSSGTHAERSWRDARGWFSYELKNEAGWTGGTELWVTLWGPDKGREFDVTINGQPAASIKMDGTRGKDFVVEKIQLPTDSNGRPMEVKFIAKPGSIAGGIFEIRVIRKE
jgi:hypothetical protein